MQVKKVQPKCNVHMFSLRVLVGKAFAEEEKKWKAQKSSVQKPEFG